MFLHELNPKIRKWLIQKSRPRLSGKVAAPAVGRGKCEQTREMILTCVRKLAPFASLCSALSPKSGTADTKEKEFIVLYLYTHLCVSLAGIFAKSHMIFFLLLSFRFYPPLKNDGRGELRLQRIFYLLCQKERMQIASRPRMTGSKRTAFRGAERRCKNEWNAIPDQRER